MCPTISEGVVLSSDLIPGWVGPCSFDVYTGAYNKSSLPPLCFWFIMQTLLSESFRDHAIAKCCYDKNCSKLFDFQNSGTALQFNFRVLHAIWMTEGLSLSSWQKICCAYYSLRTLGQGKHQATKKAFSTLLCSVNDEPDMNIWKELDNNQTLWIYVAHLLAMEVLRSQILLNLKRFYQEGHRDSNTQKGPGMTQGQAQEDSGETHKQRTTSWGKTLFSKPPNAFLNTGTDKCDLDICKGRLRMKHSLH